MPVSEAVFVLVVLLGMAMLVTGLSRKLPIPFTVVLVVIGVLLSSMAEHWPLLQPLKDFELSPEVMLFIFLPALIFESGFALDARQLTKDLPAVLILAIPGMLISTFIVGFGVWLALDTRLIIALVFGALISATDPVAVVALFKELGAPNRLNVLVEGESLLNDATAIVAFSILLAIAVEGSGIGFSDIDTVFLEFLRVFIGGALFGSFLGFVACELLYRMKANISVILTTSIIVAYAAFVVGEHSLHVSGVMAVVGAAIALRLFGMSRIRQDATHSISETWEVIALCCNSLLFLMVGLSVNTDDIMSRIGPVFIVVALVLTARALSIYTFVPLTVRWFKLPRVSMGERHIMWWGGLKGGLAIAVVLSIPSDLPERQFLFDLTIGVVLFTLLVSAPTIRPLMQRLGMNELSQGEELELRSVLVDARHKLHANLSRLLQNKLAPKMDVKRTLLDIEIAFGLGLFDEEAEQHGDDDFIARLRAYHIERRELKNLYETGYISQYIYLDMLNHLYDMREDLRQGGSEAEDEREHGKQSFFQRLEKSFLRFIRERRWSSGLMSRFQATRMVQQLQRNLAHVLMCEAVITLLKSQDDLEAGARDEVIAIYKQRKKHYRKNLKMARVRFPEFYHRYLEVLAQRSTIYSGWNHVKDQYEHGDLSSKGFVSTQHKVHKKIERLKEMEPALADDDSDIADILADLELFEALSDHDRSYLGKNATVINFLPGDTIMGAYETGDNFYIIIVGKAEVWRTDALSYAHRVAQLNDGDIMGESALLAEYERGRHARSATIKAKTPCILLRISMRAMLKTLEKYPDVKDVFQSIHDQRGVDYAPKISDD
ncbi:MAG: cyclic nucleotide-binding domain-containing protein [Gammaproteobacteria bacterium]|nr:cyclic nucleotide-binding domain-containing protein [Gammaproteobacteria bacterium]